MRVIWKSAAAALVCYSVTKTNYKNNFSFQKQKIFAFNPNYDNIEPNLNGTKVNYFNLVCCGSCEKQEDSDDYLLNKDGEIQMKLVGNFMAEQGLHKKVNEIGVAPRNVDIKCGKIIAKQIHHVTGKTILVNKKPELIDGTPAQASPRGDTCPLTDRSLFINSAKFDYMFSNNIKKPLPHTDKDGHYWIVTSQNIIKYLICRALQISPSAYNRFNISCGSVTSIACYENGTVKLLYANDRSMMHSDNQSKVSCEDFEEDD